MDYYLAPMEGLTGYVFRKTYHSFYRGFDKYFTPFIAPTKKKVLKTREFKDVDPANNEGMKVIPQILTNDADNFIDTVERLKHLGYYEVNLNLGCPSQTVVTKGKGAGFLDDPDRLDAFFENVFDRLRKVRISVKTRLGMDFSSEFFDILEVYNRYPFEEIIIHPRVREDYYAKKPDLATFAEALNKTDKDVCYNGDIFSQEDAKRIISDYPKVKAIMLGRGILKNPRLLEEITNEKLGSLHEIEAFDPSSVEMDKERKRLKAFHDALLEGYVTDLSGERDVLFKMKEFWSYFLENFRDNPDFDKLMKKIKKSQSVLEYAVAANNLFK
ncbi:MAG: tRNA-dihydrouridine synthase family protein [Lachnospiraceae bacterium]|nr:tRNA-dihydrouridine synthase family protein [Lachnospiraceae bacterium]